MVASLALVACVQAPMRLCAQSLSGTVRRVTGADTVPVANGRVVLHRISQEFQGPVDSVQTGRDGRFSFRLARADSASIYTTSTEYAGIGYFGEPVSGRGPLTAQSLLVFDTSSTGGELSLGIRHVIVPRPDAGGARRVLDIIQIINPGTTTRVGRDTLDPVWSMTIPPGLTDPQLGESDVAPSSVTFENGRLHLTAPLPPGAKQLAVSYVLASTRRFELPIDQNLARLELLVEDSTATVEGLPDAEPIDLDGRAFRRFGADSVAAGREFTINFGRTPRGETARTLMMVAVGLAAVTLIAGLRFALKPRTTPATPSMPSTPASDRDLLLSQIVALDQEFEGREAAVGAEEWAGYQKRRANLKQRLSAIVGS